MIFLNKYKLELILGLIQLLGPIAPIGVVFACVFTFYIIAFKKEIDLVSIFILLIPSIALRSAEEVLGLQINQFGERIWFQVFIPSLVSSLKVGPVAISIRLFAALAVPFRIVYFIKSQNLKFFTILWVLCLYISIYGLFLTYSSGAGSVGGITIGLRIALALGAILIPLSTDKSKLEKQLLLIVKISLVLFILGLLNEHWIFVAVAFPPFLIFSKEKMGLKIFASFFALVILLLGSTFTMKLTLLFSFVLLLLYNRKSLSNFLLKTRVRRFILFLFPVLFTIYIVYRIVPGVEYKQTFEGRFYSKLYEDRGGIWKNTIELIKKSDFFVVPAARDIIVTDYRIKGESEWGAGAHNIYLEMARQLGLFVTIILTIIMGYIMLGAIRKLKGDIFLSKFILALFAVYLVFGLTGNSLIYDGVGFLFWLIVGQLYQVSRLNKTYENTALIGSERANRSR